MSDSLTIPRLESLLVTSPQAWISRRWELLVQQWWKEVAVEAC